MAIKLKIACLILLILVYLMSYFLNKDYQLNGHVKKMITDSKYSRIAHYLSLLTVALLINLFDIAIEKYAVGIFSSATCDILFWVISPLVSVICVASVYITTYSAFLYRKKFGIKYDRNDMDT